VYIGSADHEVAANSQSIIRALCGDYFFKQRVNIILDE
jgi:hypothetical protein